MHVFLAGSTGVLGRRIIPLLIGDGHEVTALTRRSDRAGMLRSLGAHPAVADVFGPESLAAAVKLAAPDVVMHQLTDLTSGTSASNADLRARGTRNLMDAACAAGVGRVISQSIAWAYSAGCEPAVEETPLDLGAAEPRLTTIRGVAALEQMTQEAPEWVVLRYGILYGPDTWYEPRGTKPKLRPVRHAISGLTWCFAGLAWWCSGYVKVSGIAAPRRLTASRWAAVGSVSIGTVTWVPVNRTWLRVKVARWSNKPRKLR